MGGYQGQEQLRSPTPAVPSEGRQRGSRWAISGRILAAAATAGQRLRAARDVSAGGGRGTQLMQVSLILQEQMLSGTCNTNGRLMNARHLTASCTVKQTHPGISVSVSSLTSRLAHNGEV